MEPEVLLHGEFGVAGSRCALTLTREALHVQRLAPPGPGQGGRLVLPLRHVLSCRAARGGGGGGGGRARKEEEEEAHFVVYCYPPKKRMVGSAKGRQKLARTFRADGGTRTGENWAVAERWATAIKCLLLGLPLPGESEITPSLLPRSRRLLLLVNPHSGRGLAMSLCHNHILPMISEADISYNLICTEYQNHARELVKDIELSEWDGIVIVSGDGLLHEVINGLMERPDWEKAIQMPLGILPAGSGNAVAAAVNHNAGFEMLVGHQLLVNCTFLLCRGVSVPMDLVSVTTASGSRRYSFLSVAWGFVADVDIESERYRGVGAARFTMGTLVRLASLRRYRGRLSYLPAGSRPKRALCRSVTASAEGAAPPPPLGRALSCTGIWRPAGPDSPFLACEDFSFEGLSLPEEGEFAAAAAAQEDGGPGSLETDLPAPDDAARRSSDGDFPAREYSGRGSSEGGSLACEGGVRGGSGGELAASRGGGGRRSSEGDSLAHEDCGRGSPGGDSPGRGGGDADSPGPPEDELLPPLDQPVPPHWQTLEGDFVLVLAIYQSHLGADLMAAPFARFSERLLHLCYVTAGISRAALLRIFLAMEQGRHFGLGCPHLFCVPARAFRLEPLTPRGILTVDGEQVDYGPIQAQVHGGLARLITGVPGEANGV